MTQKTVMSAHYWGSAQILPNAMLMTLSGGMKVPYITKDENKAGVVAPPVTVPGVEGDLSSTHCQMLLVGPVVEDFLAQGAGATGGELVVFVEGELGLGRTDAPWAKQPYCLMLNAKRMETAPAHKHVSRSVGLIGVTGVVARKVQGVNRVSFDVAPLPYKVEGVEPLSLRIATLAEKTLANLEVGREFYVGGAAQLIRANETTEPFMLVERAATAYGR